MCVCGRIHRMSFRFINLHVSFHILRQCISNCYIFQRFITTDPKLSSASEGVFHPKGFDNRVLRRMKLRARRARTLEKVAKWLPS